jgi:hypothetical protein
MTANPAGEQVEGNIAEIDLPAQFFILEDRQGKPFLKVFWSKAQEGPAENPSYLFKKIRKLQPTYYATPIVRMEESTGGIQEAVIIDLPYKDRPADFPRPAKKGGSGSGWKGQPHNDRAIIMQCALKVAADVWIAGRPQDEILKFENEMKEITKEAIKAGDALCNAAGVP